MADHRFAEFEREMLTGLDEQLPKAKPAKRRPGRRQVIEQTMEALGVAAEHGLDRAEQAERERDQLRAGEAALAVLRDHSDQFDSDDELLDVALAVAAEYPERTGEIRGLLGDLVGGFDQVRLLAEAERQAEAATADLQRRAEAEQTENEQFAQAAEEEVQRARQTLREDDRAFLSDYLAEHHQEFTGLDSRQIAQALRTATEIARESGTATRTNEWLRGLDEELAKSVPMGERREQVAEQLSKVPHHPASADRVAERAGLVEDSSKSFFDGLDAQLQRHTSGVLGLKSGAEHDSLASLRAPRGHRPEHHSLASLQDAPPAGGD